MACAVQPDGRAEAGETAADDRDRNVVHA
jgi:hypothetical protein